MEKLTNKRVDSYEYLSRYTGIPYYYDPTNNRDVMGICKQIDTSTQYLTHKVEAKDTLDSLSLKYYNNPTFWWAIAYFNLINDPFVPLHTKFKVIKIPNISGIKFKD
jgi:alpha-L-arabinofuranosidase